MEKKVQPQKTHEHLIQQLIGDEQLKQASIMGLTVVRVSFDNENDPVFLASRTKLSYDKYLAFVKDMGIFADNYRIDGWS